MGSAALKVITSGARLANSGKVLEFYQLPDLKGVGNYIGFSHIAQ